MKQAIVSLIQQGKLSIEDVEGAIGSTFSAEDMMFASMIHQYCCDKNHDSVCDWYKESDDQTITEQTLWTLPAHKEWAQKAKDIRAIYDGTPKQLYSQQIRLLQAIENMEKTDQTWMCMIVAVLYCLYTNGDEGRTQSIIDIIKSTTIEIKS